MKPSGRRLDAGPLSRATEPETGGRLSEEPAPELARVPHPVTGCPGCVGRSPILVPDFGLGQPPLPPDWASRHEDAAGRAPREGYGGRKEEACRAGHEGGAEGASKGLPPTLLALAA